MGDAERADVVLVAFPIPDLQKAHRVAEVESETAGQGRAVLPLAALGDPAAAQLRDSRRRGGSGSAR